MSRPRSEFKNLLDTIPGANVYGVAPENTEMVYPAIRYEPNFEEPFFADNIPYEVTDRYSVTVIETDPNRPIAKAVRLLPMCSFNRYYVAENLHHSVYNIFF